MISHKLYKLSSVKQIILEMKFCFHTLRIYSNDYLWFFSLETLTVRQNNFFSFFPEKCLKTFLEYEHFLSQCFTFKFKFYNHHV